MPKTATSADGQPGYRLALNGTEPGMLAVDFETGAARLNPAIDAKPSIGRLILHTPGDEAEVLDHSNSFAVRDLHDLEQALVLLANSNVTVQKITLSGHGSMRAPGRLTDLWFSPDYNGGAAFTTTNLEAAILHSTRQAIYPEPDARRFEQLTRVVQLLAQCAPRVSVFACGIGDGDRGKQFREAFLKLASLPVAQTPTFHPAPGDAAGSSDNYPQATNPALQRQADVRLWLPRGYATWGCAWFPKGVTPRFMNPLIRHKLES